MITLRKLNIHDEISFIQALKSWDGYRGFIFFQGYEPGMKFLDYINLLDSYKAGKNLPEGWVPMTSLFAFEGNEIAGRLAIRHKLSDHLLKIGGHIGYGIIPQFRKKGYATQILKMAIPISKDLGIERLLLTCDDNNIGSIKVIEACGGVLENKLEVGEGKPMKRRYWIDAR